ncbi:MAG: alpha/beta hydrolase [Flavobacteriales bacterium]
MIIRYFVIFAVFLITCTPKAQVISKTDTVSADDHSRTAHVQVLTDSFPMTPLQGTRRIWVCLPPEYETSERNYPVLYMQDGQNLFDRKTSFVGEWNIDETMATLPDSLQCIIVGIDNAGADRAAEYAYYPNKKYHVEPRGQDYVQFITTHLKPAIDSLYRTHSERESTYIGGSSLGALIAAFAVLENQPQFGGALLFSPAYWFNPEIDEIAMFGEPQLRLRIYQVASQLEDNGSVAKHCTSMDSWLSSGNNELINMHTKITEDGAHSEWFWAREFPEAIKWMMGGEEN